MSPRVGSSSPRACIRETGTETQGFLTVSTVKILVSRSDYRGKDECATRFLGELDCSLIVAGGAVAECRALSGFFELKT